MEVRQIKKSEIPKAVPLFISSFYASPYDEKWSEERARRRLEELYANGKDFCLIAKETEIVGLLFSRTQIWDDGVHVFIEDLAVSEGYRRKGIASLLVKTLEDIAKDKQIAAIDLAVNKHAGAMEFWTKMGYAASDYVLMKKNIGGL